MENKNGIETSAMESTVHFLLCQVAVNRQAT